MPLKRTHCDSLGVYAVYGECVGGCLLARTGTLFRKVQKRQSVAGSNLPTETNVPRRCDFYSTDLNSFIH